MTTIHTPGPWIAPETNQVNYMGDTYNADVVYRRDSADLAPIAFVVMGDPEESVANAALIAAAPELLEALKECANRLEIHMKHTEDLVAHMRACKAIAKAEGR